MTHPSKCLRFCLVTAALATAWATLLPTTAWAVQQHGGAEGLVSHQIGHILFITGMAYMFYRIHRTHETGPGWFEFRVFLFLIILWNGLTFTGHWLQEFVDHAKFVTLSDTTMAYRITDFTDCIYYLSRLDHLLLVPSFLFLLLALNKWRQTP